MQIKFKFPLSVHYRKVKESSTCYGNLKGVTIPPVWVPNTLQGHLRSCISSRWKFVLDGDMQSPQKSRHEESDIITAASAAKRKSNEPSPNGTKRPRSSDAQTEWVLKNARLLKQLEVMPVSSCIA